MEGSIEKAETILKEAGAEKIFIVSSYNNEGIDELIEYLKKEAE